MTKHIFSSVSIFIFAVSAVSAQDAVYNYDQSGGNQFLQQQPVIAPPVAKLAPPTTYIAPPVDPGIPAPMLGFNGTMIHGYGLRVNSVNNFSKAQRIGLETNDVITAINGVTVYSHHQYQQLLREALQFNGGQVAMRVINSRPWPAPKVVTINFRLDEAMVPCHGGQPSYSSFKN